jgi:hypothetical protein
MRLIAFLFVASSLFAQPTLTTISDTVYNSVTGTPFNGTVIVHGPNFTSPTNIPVLGINRTVTVTNGALSVSVVPNDTGAPSGSYYLMIFSNGDKKTCTVPTSSTPLTLADANCIDGSPQVAIPGTVALSQLASGGAVTGQALCFGSASWGPGACAPPAPFLASASFTAARATPTIFCDATSGPVTVSLPSAAGSIPPASGLWRGQILVLKKTDSSSNACSFASLTGDTFDGAPGPLSLTSQHSSYTIQSDGSGWQIIGGRP